MPGDDGTLQVPLNLFVRFDTDATASAKGSDSRMVAMICTARQFDAQMKMLHVTCLEAIPKLSRAR